ncbi:Ef-Hand Calcium-Binding Domain-Containing Protein 7 [Manis pentadactyla]|nr:Ef-Hand Calcium-Binding Domain-Containing Protein 7 [Manis pentadactyla]
MHQQISLDQNMLFQETSVNKTLDAWVELVGDGHAPSWGVAEACPFQGASRTAHRHGPVPDTDTAALFWKRASLVIGL